MTPPIRLDDRIVGYFEYIKIQTSPVIPSERSESRNLGADLTVNLNEMRRFLDALRLLEMTYCFFVFETNQPLIFISWSAGRCVAQRITNQ